MLEKLYRTIAAVITAVTAGVSGVPQIPPYETARQVLQAETADTVQNNITDQVYQLTNRERIWHGMKVLKLDPALCRTAQDYAVYMYEHEYFEHITPDGITPKDRAEQHGAEYHAVGENIARNQQTAEQAVDAWVKSPGHRENILRSIFTDTGIGYCNGYWVQIFGGEKAD